MAWSSDFKVEGYPRFVTVSKPLGTVFDFKIPFDCTSHQKIVKTSIRVIWWLQNDCNSFIGSKIIWNVWYTPRIFEKYVSNNFYVTNKIFDSFRWYLKIVIDFTHFPTAIVNRISSRLFCQNRQKLLNKILSKECTNVIPGKCIADDFLILTLLIMSSYFNGRY